MAGDIIHPDQVQAAQAQRILQFLNNATTTLQITSNTELPGEPDIGVALAERILHQREILGGRFNELQQLIDIPYIGPERFTDLVRALGTSMDDQEEPTIMELAQDIRNLQQQLAALSQHGTTSQHLTLTTDKTRLYLGQKTLLKATLKNKFTGEALIGYPVTFFCHWGQLRTINQQHTQRGSSVTVHTASDGVARAVLSPLTAETLISNQQDALINALGKLPVDAPTPQSIIDDLHNLGRSYHQSNNYMLRNAIDTYLQEFHPNIKDTLYTNNHLANWQQQQVAIMALAQGGTPDSLLSPVQGDSSVQVSAIFNLSVIDWLPAWIEAFIQLKENESSLSNNLGFIPKLEGGKYSLDNTVNYYIKDFIRQQRGLVGEYAGQRIIDKAVNAFIEKDMPAISQELQSTLYTNLRSTTKTLASNGLKGLQSAEQTRLSLKQDISRDYTSKTSLEKSINGLSSSVDERLASTVKRDGLERSISGLSTSVDERLATTLKKDDLEHSINGLSKNINLRLQDTLSKNDLTAIRNSMSELSKRVDQRLQNTVRQNDLTGIKTSISELSENIDQRLQDTVNKNDLKESENSLRESIDTKASKAELSTIDTGLRTEINQKNKTINARIKNEIVKVNNNIKRIKLSGPGR